MLQLLQVKLDNYFDYYCFSIPNYDVSFCDVIKNNLLESAGFDDYLSLFDAIKMYTEDELSRIENMDETELRTYLNSLVSHVPLNILFECFDKAFDEFFVPNSLAEIKQAIQKAKTYLDCKILKMNNEEICYNATCDYFRELFNGEKNTVDEDTFYEMCADLCYRLDDYLESVDDYE